jgi:hypothetical protein
MVDQGRSSGHTQDPRWDPPVSLVFLESAFELALPLDDKEPPFGFCRLNALFPFFFLLLLLRRDISFCFSGIKLRIMQD